MDHGELDSGCRHSAEGDLWRPNKRRVMGDAILHVDVGKAQPD